MSASCAAQQGVLMKRIMTEKNFIPSSLTVIFCDNKQPISMTKNPVFHGRTKLRELRYQFIRDQVISGTIEVKFFSIKDQVADGLTKTLNYTYFMKFLGDLGVRSFV